MDQFLLDPISKNVMLDPVILPCGHTFGRLSIEAWILSNGQRCPMQCRESEQNPFTLVPNRALALALDKEEITDRIFLKLDSEAPFKPSLFPAYKSRQVHHIRQSVIGLLENGFLIGSTPREFRRIARRDHNVLVDGERTNAIFSAETDLDIAFSNEKELLDFVRKLSALFVLKSKFSDYFLQGLRVMSYRVSFRFQEGSGISLSVDLVCPDPSVGIGSTWPDFVECQLACHMTLGKPSYDFNPLIDLHSFFRKIWPRGGITESPRDRFLHDLICRIDEQKPWQWCLLRPEFFTRLIKTDKYLQSEAYELYVMSMLRRLSKFLYRGVTVVGISITFSQQAQMFLLPCGHMTASLHLLECFYNDQRDVLEYVCKDEIRVYDLFSSFLPLVV